MNTAEFYKSLNIVPTFKEVSNPKLYTPLPDNWHLALADIRGSTDAIRMGKYKEVNMAGASLIAALNNFYDQENLLPHLFGGDGSLIALPNQKIDEAKGILAFCKNAVKNAYDLEMAAGIVSMKELREAGHDIGIARLRLSDFIDQTIFWGSGVTYAEELIKKENRLEKTEPIEADFSGLECRWSQVPSGKDEVAAYLIQTYEKNNAESAEIYERCFAKIAEIFGDEKDYHPIRKDALKMTVNPLLLGVEWKLRTQPPTLIKKLKHFGRMMLQLLTGLYLMKFKKKTNSTNWGDYKPDLIQHADYKKFGNGLRFMASGTIQQRMKMIQFLDEEFSKRNLVYGVHSSFEAMITCYVRSYQSYHIHFVDGSDGGYAKASQELKNRLLQLKMS
ncbi:MAG: DUF3095 family protein [Gracilimonas sp.]|uniref:DUF3095 family protein n=1 Tax=Gracilimonas sp. TaxID=1974203 RepID=UPI0019CB1AA7|nr:DUF3095 family protein [Gracilimonas sp.]MBD3615088.1 DUF3095 family protein [Gracilimonas sp.]